MDVEILSRLQFAGTIMVHYLFPPLSIGFPVAYATVFSSYYTVFFLLLTCESAGR